jgi:hypothetical protein
VALSQRLTERLTGPVSAATSAMNDPDNIRQTILRVAGKRSRRAFA